MNNTQESTIKNQRFMLAAVVLTLILAALVIWASTDPDALKTPIDLHLTVVHADESETTYDIRTIRTNLAEILQDEELLAGVYLDSDDNYYTAEQYEALVAAAEETEDAASAADAIADGTPDPDDIHFRVTYVDGEYTDADLGQYWLCYQSGTRITDPVDTIEISDEDEVRFVYYQQEVEDTE